VPTQSFYSSRPDSYIVPQGPTGGAGMVGNLLQQLGLLCLGIANDGLGNTWSAPCPVSLPHHARPAAWLGSIASPGTIAVPYVWSSGSALHYSHLFAYLVGIKCDVCPHVLQAHDDRDVWCLGNMHAFLRNM
jgi:hypothetical protein